MAPRCGCLRVIIQESETDMKKIAIIHTTTATVEPLKALAAELLPDYQVVNFVDDAVLPQLLENGGDVTAVAGRLVQYARFAAEVGATAILSACSSVGEVVAQMQAAVPVPVVRIDEAMARAAVQRALQANGRIAVAATLPTTLQPTCRLLEQTAVAAGQGLAITPLLVEGAYQKLMAGDKEGHDQALVAALGEAAAQADVVVLAQVSMARVLPHLPEAQRARFLTSPQPALEQLRDSLQNFSMDEAHHNR
jgi:glutamate racemase